MKGLYYGLENAFFANSYSLVASQSAFNLTTGTLGKFIPFAALAIGFVIDLHDGKTIGQSVMHAGATGFIAWGTANVIGGLAIVLGFGTPVGWVAIGIGAVAATIASVIYDKNIFGIQDKCNELGGWIDDKISLVGEAISGSYENIRSSFGW